MSKQQSEDQHDDENYAVYDEASCRGHGRRIGLGFLSRSIKKNEKKTQINPILSKSKLIGKENLDKNHDKLENSG